MVSKDQKGCARVYMNGYNDAKIRYKKVIKKINEITINIVGVAIVAFNKREREM